MIIIKIEIIDAFKVPKSSPPFAPGLVKKSPKVAPKGLVKIKAIQKKIKRLLKKVEKVLYA